MKAKPLLMGVAAVTGLLLVVLVGPMLFPSKPGIQARHLRTNRSPVYGITETFEVRNDTAARVSFYPAAFEVQTGAVWTACYQFKSGYQNAEHLAPHTVTSVTYETPPLPTGCPIRLRFGANRENRGLRGFLMRLRIHFIPGARISLNPWDKTSHVYTAVDLLSETFTQQ